jgi:hypothetical protein
MIRGYLRLGQESRSLWDSRAIYDEVVRTNAIDGDPIWNHCVTIYYDLSISRQITSLAGMDVEITGTVGLNRNGAEGWDLWSCNDVYVTAQNVRRSGPD